MDIIFKEVADALFTLLITAKSPALTDIEFSVSEYIVPAPASVLKGIVTDNAVLAILAVLLPFINVITILPDAGCSPDASIKKFFKYPLLGNITTRLANVALNAPDDKEV